LIITFCYLAPNPSLFAYNFHSDYNKFRKIRLKFKLWERGCVVRKIEVVSYDPRWPEMYQVEVERLTPAVGAQVIAFHHIGSTSVPGLCAKPTIDILAEVYSLAALDTCNKAMQALGYNPKGENGIVGRRYFNRLAGEVHLFHLHAFQTGHPAIAEHLAFRDYLRTHPAVAGEYTALKRRLAEQFTFDSLAYTEGKAAFITEVVQKVVAWGENVEGG
jgi:GrpB-like predicted nucleotidyltransferase (UPF0157 family)